MENCQWGILGCANIARKACRAITLGNQGNVSAVASRSAEKAKQFIKEVGLENNGVSVCSYDELLKLETVDAIYVPVPTKMHLEWVTKCAKAGKHVLLEKPVSLNANEFMDMIRVCDKYNVILMDGTMFHHHERTKMIVNRLNDPLQFFGDVERITSAFTFRGGDDFFGRNGGSPNIRLLKNGDSLGCVGDLGWYSIRWALVFFKSMSEDGCMPYSVEAKCLQRSEEEVPIDVSADVFFSKDKSKVLSFHCSFVHNHKHWAEISTSSKVITIPDIDNPDYPSEAGFTVRHFPPGDPNVDLFTQSLHTDEHVKTFNCSHEVEMYQNFNKLVLDKTPSKFTRDWARLSLVTQAVVDAVMTSLNNKSKNTKVVQYQY